MRGYRKHQDTLSRERLIIARKMMWSALAPHVKGLKEEEVISFPWEKEILKQLSLDEIAQVQAEVEEAKSFWDDYDQQKLQSN